MSIALHKSEVPAGAFGAWSVLKVQWPEETPGWALEELAGAPAGEYTALVNPDFEHSGRWGCIMIDSPSVGAQQQSFIEAAAAIDDAWIVLGGLGLGWAAQRIAALCPNVARITVIENDADVIDLVWPTIEALDPRITLINADASRPQLINTLLLIVAGLLGRDQPDLVWLDIWAHPVGETIQQRDDAAAAWSTRCSEYMEYGRDLAEQDAIRKAGGDA